MRWARFLPCKRNLPLAVSTADRKKNHRWSLSMATTTEQLWFKHPTNVSVGAVLFVSLLCWFHSMRCDALQIGTWKSGQSIIYTGIRHPSSIMKNVIPIVMAGGMWLYFMLRYSWMHCLIFLSFWSRALIALHWMNNRTNANIFRTWIDAGFPISQCARQSFVDQPSRCDAMRCDTIRHTIILLCLSLVIYLFQSNRYLRANCGRNHRTIHHITIEWTREFVQYL